MAIAALIQATVGHALQAACDQQGAIATTGARCSWRTNSAPSRYGLDGKLIDFGKEEEVPLRQLMLEYLDMVGDVADELGSRDEINYIHQMLKMGTGADRQLKVYEETGDLKKVVDYIVAETRLGVFEQASASR